ncbi:hypothetical protein IV417_12425 [Alphaproteobacteria bacterium KMM 3653]|uniref:Uncharacterized protein n=1 Tax=Harenicola maris TaxID=2841044 RepID=A0AAP2G8D0_9RHOB|nr:hypothetical protein [Harenicola maris]
MQVWRVLVAALVLPFGAQAQAQEAQEPRRLEGAVQGFLDVLAQEGPDASFALFNERLRGIVPREEWHAMRGGQTETFGALGPLSAHSFDTREGDAARVFVSFSGTYGGADDPVCGLVIWSAPEGEEPLVGGIYLNFLPMDRVSLMPDAQLAQLEQQARCPAGLLSPG